MKYVILRRQPGVGPSPAVIYRGSTAPLPPLQIESQDLSDQDVRDLRHDPGVEDVVLSMPFRLIQPVAKATAAAGPQVAWGIDAVKARTSDMTGEGVTVAVLDTGIDEKHAAFDGIDFGPQKQNLMDFTVDPKGVSGKAHDSDGHGTHVAGTIFGREVNGVRIGVAPGVKNVLIGKVLGDDGGGSTDAILNGIEWALRSGANIISMSLRFDYTGLVGEFVKYYKFPEEIAVSRALEGYRSNVRLFDRLASQVAARTAVGGGAILVAASGNESLRKKDSRFTVASAPPAVGDGFVSVGAVGQDGRIADFSNTGCHFTAPGVGVLSAEAGGQLTTMDGTSQATPHAAGVIALWIQRLFSPDDRPPDWTRDVMRYVEQHVVPADRGVRNDYGLGLVQAPQPR